MSAKECKENFAKLGAQYQRYDAPFRMQRLSRPPPEGMLHKASKGPFANFVLRARSPSLSPCPQRAALLLASSFPAGSVAIACPELLRCRHSHLGESLIEAGFLRLPTWHDISRFTLSSLCLLQKKTVALISGLRLGYVSDRPSVLGCGSSLTDFVVVFEEGFGS